MGIESMVRADDAGGEQPGLWIGEGVQILVRARDAELAKMVISGSSFRYLMRCGCSAAAPNRRFRSAS